MGLAAFSLCLDEEMGFADSTVALEKKVVQAAASSGMSALVEHRSGQGMKGELGEQPRSCMYSAQSAQMSVPLDQ